MPRKLLVVFIIIVLAMLLLSVLKSRKDLWMSTGKRNTRLFTFRSVAIIIGLIIFLIFSYRR